MEKKTLNVAGMSCEHCVKAVNQALSGIGGVANVVVSLRDKTVSFDYDPALASLDAVTAAISEAGYEVV